MSRNTPANIQLNLPQFTYESAQLSVPNPVNTVAPANTQWQQILLQSLDALGTGVYRYGQVVGRNRDRIEQTQAAQQAAAKALGQTEGEDWLPRLKDGMLDSPDDIARGATPVSDWFDAMYQASRANGIPIEESIRGGMTEWIVGRTPEDMTAQEASAYQSAYLDKVMPDAIAYARRTYIKPQYEAIRENFVLGLATLSLEELGVGRGRELTRVGAENLEKLAKQGITDSEDSVPQVMLDAAEVAVAEGNFGRATQLLEAAGVVQGDMLGQQEAIRESLGRAVRGEAVQGISEMLHNYTGAVSFDSELRQLVRSAQQSGPESFARDLEASLDAWATESSMPPHLQRSVIRELRDSLDSSEEPVFETGGRAYAAITRSVAGIKDADERYASARAKIDDQGQDLVFEYLETGGIEGTPMNDAQFFSHLQGALKNRSFYWMSEMRRIRTRDVEGVETDPRVRTRLDQAIREAFTTPRRQEIRAEINEAFESGALDRTDYTQLNSALADSAKFDRIRQSPAINDFRSSIARSFVTAITGEDPGMEGRLASKFEGSAADMTPAAFGAMNGLLADFDDAFYDLQISKEMTEAIEQGRWSQVDRLERAFLREMNNKFFGNETEEGLVATRSTQYLPSEQR